MSMNLFKILKDDLQKKGLSIGETLREQEWFLFGLAENDVNYEIEEHYEHIASNEKDNTVVSIFKYREKLYKVEYKKLSFNYCCVDLIWDPIRKKKQKQKTVIYYE